MKVRRPPNMNAPYSTRPTVRVVRQSFMGPMRMTRVRGNGRGRYGFWLYLPSFSNVVVAVRGGGNRAGYIK